MLSRILLLFICAVAAANALTTATPVLTGLSAAVGQTFSPTDGSIYFTEWSANRISYYNPASNQSGTIFSSFCTGLINANPQDIAVSPGEIVLGKPAFYVTCRNGNMFKLNWGIKTIFPSPTFGWVRTLVASSLGMPHQLQLDGAGFAYTVDYQFGRVLRVTLVGGTVSTLASGLPKPIGIILTSDSKKAFVSLDGVLGFRKVNLVTGFAGEVVTYTTDGGLAVTNPFYLLWDVQDQSFYATSRDKRFLVRFALNTVPATVTTTVKNLPTLPSSVCRAFSNFALYVASDSVLTRVSWFIIFPPFGFAQPTIYRLGHIPSTEINGTTGLATTDPAYFFHVKNAPFGGTVQMFFNFAKMRSLNAAYYRVFLDGSSAPTYASWNNYKWIGSSFQLRAVAADASGRYTVPPASDLWAYQDLGFVLDTTMLASNSVHNLAVKLYRSNGASISIPLLSRSMESVNFFVDNVPPQVYINAIQQAPGTPIAECGLLTSGSPKLIFNVTAYDPLGYLDSWSLIDAYGQGNAAGIASDVYEPTHSGAAQWFGVKHHTVVFNLCTTTTQCAHSFNLGATSRATNGYNQIFYRSDFETLAVYLPAETCA